MAGVDGGGMVAAGAALAQPDAIEATAEVAVDDSARLRRLVDSHFAFVGRSLRGLGMRESDVDDGAQQVFLVAARRLAEIDEGRERAFLFQTVLRIASRARRTYGRRREVSDERLGEKSDPRPGPDELTEQRRARERLDQVLDTMPTDFRSVFVLYEIEQLTMAEIANVVGVPAGTVASRLRRARELFEQGVRMTDARGGRRS